MSISADDNILDAFAILDAAAVTSGAPTSFSRAVRTGTPGTRHRVTVDGVPAHITIRTQSPGPRRDTECFTQLLAAMKAATVDGIQPELPAEISMVVWEHEGRELRVCAPGTAAAIRRARKRIRDRLTALSPLPLLGALTQPIAGSATAVGIAIAPVLPPANPTAPPPGIVREMTGDIARPELPYQPGTVPVPALLGLTAPVLPTLPAPEQAAPDQSTQAPTGPAPDTAPSPTTAPAAAAPREPEPGPTVTGSETALDDPTGTPPLNPGDLTPTEPSPAPSVSPTRRLDRLLHPRHRNHNRHGRHPLRGLPEHR